MSSASWPQHNLKPFHVSEDIFSLHDPRHCVNEEMHRAPSSPNVSFDQSLTWTWNQFHSFSPMYYSTCIYAIRGLMTFTVSCVSALNTREEGYILEVGALVCYRYSACHAFCPAELTTCKFNYIYPVCKANVVHRNDLNSVDPAGGMHCTTSVQFQESLS